MNARSRAGGAAPIATRDSARPAVAARPIPTSRYKLADSSAHNTHEAEADRVADHAIGAASGTGYGDWPRVARSTDLYSHTTTAAPTSVDNVLGGSGRQLGAGIRSDMERGFRCDFSRVRIHADDVAAATARELGAHAFTVGENVVFGAREFAPHTREGRHLIAHELTHVVQQRGSAAGGRIVQSKPIVGAKSTAKKKSTIVAIHAKPNELVGSAYLAEGGTPIDIKLSKNLLTEGRYEFIKTDDPTTKFVEFRSEAGQSFVWHLPPGKFAGSKVEVTIKAASFSFEEIAQQRFDAVPERIKTRLYRTHGKKLETPQEKLGFAKFAEILQQRGVTDGELILFQRRGNTGFAWHRIDWATEWSEAADVVIGARARLDKETISNVGNFMMNAARLPELSEKALDAYRQHGGFLAPPGMDLLTKEVLEESGISLEQLDAILDAMMLSFDAQMRLETDAALDAMEGGLQSAKEQYVDNRKGGDEITKILAAAGKEPTLAKKAARARAEEARRDAKSNLPGVVETISGISRIDFESANKLAVAEGNYKKAHSDYIEQLESISGLPVRSWGHFNVEQFFYGRGAYTPQYWLRSYIKQALADLERARTMLDGNKNKRTLYKCDAMVQHTKKVMGITKGSAIDQLVDEKVKEFQDAPFFEWLVDFLTIALMFIPGGQLVAMARVTFGAVNTLNVVQDEHKNQAMYLAHLRTTGASLGNVGLSAVDTLFNIPDLARIARGQVSAISHGADAAEGVVARMERKELGPSGDIGNASAKTDPQIAQSSTHVELPTLREPEQAAVVDASKKLPDDAPVPTKPDESSFAGLDAEVTQVPLNEASFMEFGAELHNVPVQHGPQLGQKMGKQDRVLKRELTDEERRALADKERKMAERRYVLAKNERKMAGRETAIAMKKLSRENPAMHREIMSSKERTKSNQSMAEIYANNPSGMERYYDEYLINLAEKSIKERQQSTFGKYVNYRLSGERGTAGELTDAFVRGSDEILVKAPKSQSNLRGSDSISYHPAKKRIKYLDNKSQTTDSTVAGVSALERNLIRNLGDDILDIQKSVLDSDVPDVIAKEVLPRLKGAREELLEYNRKNPVTKANATRPDVRDAYDAILRNHGIDRVVTLAGSGEGVKLSKGLKGAGFKVE